MRFVIFLFLSFFISNTLFAQTAKGTIFVDYLFFGNDYYIDGKEYNREEIIHLLESDKLSNEYLNKSYNNKNWGYVTLSVGLVFNFISWQELKTSNDTKYKQQLEAAFFLKAAIGIGLDLVAILCFSNSKSSFSNAIKAYNKCLIKDTGSNEFKVNIDFNRITFTYSM